jgi:DNA-binding CsgD family transcriptional regulator
MAGHGLTETERRVAALVVQGLTSDEVASVLSVTKNTVQTHVQPIFKELGVGSCAELVAWILSTRARTTTSIRSSMDRIALSSFADRLHAPNT